MFNHTHKQQEELSSFPSQETPKLQTLELTGFGGPEVLQLNESSTLPEPKPHEARIKVEASSISFTDTMIRRGRYFEAPTKTPFVLGYDLVGIVDKVGSKVKHLQPGQRVADLTVIGANTTYACRPADQLVPVPETLDPAEAVSMVLSYQTAYQMLYREAKIKPGQNILVHGAGGAVGSALLQLAQVQGIRAVGTARAKHHDNLKALGVTPIDYSTENWAERAKEVCPEGFDAAFDFVSMASFRASFSLLRKGGKLVVYGMHNKARGPEGSKGGVASVFLKMLFWSMWKNLLPNGKKITFYSITSMRKKQSKWFNEDLQSLFALLEQKKLKPIIEKKVQFDEAIYAHQLLEEGGVRGKIVLLP